MRSKGLAVALVAGVALVVVPVAQAATGVVANWGLDEGAGTRAADSSVFGNHGTLEGGVDWTSGHTGGGLAFDAGTGHVSVPASDSLAPARVTAEVWVKRSGSPGAYKYILAKGASGCLASSYALYTGPDGGLVFYVSDGLTFTRSPDAGAGVWDGAWHHVAGSFDGASVRLFLDGTEVGTGTPRTEAIGYGLVSGDELRLGNYAGCSGLEFSGAIDAGKVWTRALSPTEIQASMLDYGFKGFFAPVDNAPTVNSVKAGSAIPVKFSLTGYQGMSIIPSDGSSSQQIQCDASAAIDALEETAAPGDSTLTYDPSSDHYQYVWKSDKAWAGSCRRLVLQLVDGSTHTALFKFLK
jgi:hypothetical protein